METPVYSITHAAAAERVDRILATQFPNHSRSYFQQLIHDEHVQINGFTAKKPSTIVNEGEIVTVSFPPVLPVGGLPLPASDTGIRLVYEHLDFLIVYKPAGVLVHAPNHHKQTFSLVDWLIHSFKELKTVGYADRPGIVHRLDKDTSGLLIIPRTNSSHAYFAQLFAQRHIHKKYYALVHGHTPAQGSIDFAIARHPHQKHKMTHTTGAGREALTHYRALAYGDHNTLVEVELITGRTHQIRVHFAALGHPVVGDSIYGAPSKSIARQALHAYQISFTYQNRWYSFWYDMPQDMKSLID